MQDPEANAKCYWVSGCRQIADGWVFVFRALSSLVATATSTSRLVILLSCEFCWFCAEFILASIGYWYVWACLGTLKAWDDISDVTWAVPRNGLSYVWMTCMMRFNVSLTVDNGRIVLGCRKGRC